MKAKPVEPPDATTAEIAADQAEEDAAEDAATSAAGARGPSPLLKEPIPAALPSAGAGNALLREPPPGLPPEPAPGVLLRQKPIIPEHLVLKPMCCPKCQKPMSVTGNFGSCGSCRYKGPIA